MDVVKLDRDVAYIAIVIYVRCKCLFPIFHLFFSDVCCKCVCLWIFILHSHICYKCFIWMLRMCCNSFQVFHVFFFQVFQTYISSVLSVLRRILQVLYLDVLKVDRMLHLLPRFCCLALVFLLLAFCCLVSFSNYRGGAAGAMEGARRGMAARQKRMLSPSVCR
jgi:hypothetical protein